MDHPVKAFVEAVARLGGARLYLRTRQRKGGKMRCEMGALRDCEGISRILRRDKGVLAKI
eukprot:5056121-Pleurochrysis_carterae.AAC.1